jgi:hypothetical protein
VLTADEREQLLERLRLGLDPVLDVRTVEARDELLRRAEIEPRDDLFVRLLGRRRGERDARNGWPALVQKVQLKVVGTEVVTPLRNTVSFVDREQRDVRPVEEREGRLHLEALGREIQKVEFAGEERGFDAHPLVAVLGRVEERRAHTDRRKGVDLVLHQRDERRDDDAGSRSDESGDLVAQRLTAAGRHENESVAAAHDLLDDVGLAVAERVIPEDSMQDLERVGRCWSFVGKCHGITAP